MIPPSGVSGNELYEPMIETPKRDGISEPRYKRLEIIESTTPGKENTTREADV